ncbi:glycolate oxidase subunit GlcE [Haliea sp. E1-2-M8]|uniref:glycolate oxidase subunit GlcE n=1 Tax=Haliea sp. E1-2-M8 TaxID=3064706 RepID=UPI0027255801|nr:glycolate oxidase subunit GlcE [Haliea sp. E1-2-M8]MDO8863066.1 glycolate oxidase subunit GlcE [Haliea sp. E1-2-M8]
MTDLIETLCDRVRSARAAGTPLRIRGGDSKRQWLGRPCAEENILDLAQHRGVVAYEPGELVLVARAGTPIAELTEVLAAEHQVLAFEPPAGGGRATLGGTLASNCSGPARPWSGAVRDAVLGVKLLTGQGECLNFGGRVVKNVAGYDVSRLQAGALGSLGVIAEVSLKVMPAPEATRTLALERDAEAALADMSRYARESTPLTGACWLQGRLFLRLSGAAAAVEASARRWGGDTVTAKDAPWHALGEFAAGAQAAAKPLWRVSLAGNAPLPSGAMPLLIDWAGALRWFAADGFDAFRYAGDHGGHAALWWPPAGWEDETAQPLSPTLQSLHQQLKMAFDPDRILNPGRLYSWL